MFPVSLAVAAFALSADVKSFDWPQWRGPNRDGVSQETGLLQDWPKDGPPKAWTVSGCGGGYSTVAVAGGFIYGTGKIDNKDHVWCRKEADGKPVWSTPIGEYRKTGYEEGTRSTPTVAGGRVFAVTPGGTLVCINAKDGKEVWRKDYVKDFGGNVPGWGYSDSVLVDGDLVICAPAGKKAAVAALKAANGAVVWQTEGAKVGGAAGYSSPVKTTVGKTDMYVVLLGKGGGVTGVDAKTGKLLWQYDKIMNGTANIPTAVVKGDRIWASTGYGDGGSALLHIKQSGGKFEAEEVKYYDKAVQNHHGGMVLVGDYVYFGNAHNSGHPACVDFKTGDVKWKETKGAAGGSGSGSVVYADGRLYFRYENGKVALVKADPDKFEAAGSFDIPEKSGKPSWQHPVIANGKLYLRDQDKLHCFDVKK
ncbi:MAG: PQQ-like beta-propeller repeat protein [Fimbriiglobus sp.]|nr:PQQ-like beta-propeller repeat protein [Fimbriiglobus sp.]